MYKLSKKHGTKQVLKDISLSYFYGAKIGVIGLNGSGKSTLLRIMAGVDTEFSGEVSLSPGYTIGYLEQEPYLAPGKTVKEIVSEGVQEIVDLIKEFEAVSEAFGDPDADYEKLANRQAVLQEQIEAADGWNLDSRLDLAMDALRCPPPETPVNVLSGGERRRVALCRLLLQKPDILLLDEPTNHLDMQSKDILKNALLQFKGTLIIVSHDRDFLQGLTEKVFEFKNKTIKTYIGDIYDFLEYKNLENLKQLETTEKLNYEDKSEKISENKINWEKRKINEKEIRKIKNKIQKCEDEISRLENEISMMDSIMANPEEFQKNIENNSFFSKYEILKQNLNQQIQLWEELHYELLENEE